MVARPRAEEALRALLAAGALDPSRKVARGASVVIPVLGRPDLSTLAQSVGGDLVEADDLEERAQRLTPYEEALARLPPAWRALAPDRWEKFGDVLVIRLAEGLQPHAREVAAAYADALDAKCVVEDVCGVAGELREMQARVLYGDDPEATHLENGVRYRFDASRIMFSSGNVAERKRAAGLAAAGETVVDMFAGIGYFTLPVAMYTGAARVVALEKNPLSFRYLEENVRLNRVEGVVLPWLGDNREYPHEGIADRVLMGYFPGCAKFLPKAFALLKPTGGRIHYHDTAHAERWKDETTRALLDAARTCGRVVAIEEARVVKSHSPGVVHAVLVARVVGGRDAAASAPPTRGREGP